MILLVCGGRDFANGRGLHDALDALHGEKPVSRLINGGCRGADVMATQWARYRSIPVSVYHADWKRFGKSAGTIRNAQMLKYGKPDMVLAVAGGPGTADMVARAREAGVLVRDLRALVR